MAWLLRSLFLTIRGLRKVTQLVTHISISLQRGRVNLSASAHVQQAYLLWKAVYDWLGPKSLKHTIKTPLHIFFLSYICNILPQHVLLNADWWWVCSIRPFQMQAWSCITSYYSPLRGSHCHMLDTVNPTMVNSMMLYSSMLASEKVYSKW